MEAADMLVSVSGLNHFAGTQFKQSEFNRMHEFSRATMMPKAAAIMHGCFAWLLMVVADVAFLG